MRKLFVITLGMLLAVPAIADVMPTFYGKLNREVQMKNLDAENADTKDVGNIRPVDVANSESRLGVKGEYTFNDHTAKYVLELGMNSSGNETSGTLGLRESFVEIGGFWGSIITGQTYVAGDMLGIKLDPLSGTSAGLAAVDVQKLLTGTYDINSDHALGAYGVGYTYRSRKELIGYKTPNFGGFQYYTTIDNNDSVALAGNKMTVWSNQASFEKEMNGMNLGVYAAYDVLSGGGFKDASVMGFGASFGMMGFGLTGMYTMSESTDTDTAGAKPYETTQMMVTGKYTFKETNTFAVTYGKMSNEDKNQTGNAAKNNQSQIAAAFIKELHKNVSVRASYGIFKKEQEDTTANKDTIANGGGFEATIAAIGTTITF